MRSIGYGLALAVALLSAACVPMEEQKATRAAEEQIAHAMRDPDSVQFRDVSVVQSPKGLRVCGEFNATNGYGGYIGFRPFVAGGGTGEVFYPHQEDDFETSDMIRQICKDLQAAENEWPPP